MSFFFTFMVTLVVTVTKSEKPMVMDLVRLKKCPLIDFSIFSLYQCSLGWIQVIYYDDT